MKTISDYYKKENLSFDELIILVILPIIKFAKKTILQKKCGKAPFPEEYEVDSKLKDLKQIDDELIVVLFQETKISRDRLNECVSATISIIKETDQYIKNKSLKEDFLWMNDTLNNILNID